MITALHRCVQGKSLELTGGRMSGYLSTGNRSTATRAPTTRAGRFGRTRWVGQLPFVPSIGRLARPER